MDMTELTERPNPSSTPTKAVRPAWGLSRFWWLVLFFWLIVSLASGLETSLMHMDSRREVFEETACRLLAWIFMTLLVAWISSTYTLDRVNWKRAIWVYLAACVLSLEVMAMLTYLGPRPLLAKSVKSVDGSESMMISVLLRLTYQIPTFWGLVAVAHAVRLYERENSRKLLEAELRTRLIQAQLQALQLQLNPHFLFNTLNSIASLVADNPAKAEKMIVALGDLLRLTIATTERQQITLREELHFLDQYLFIQCIRFGERLQIKMQIDPSHLENLVPALILQPLVENAIKHGVENQLGPCRLVIASTATEAADVLCLEVSNDGPVLPARTGPIRERVGLTNTRARLEAMFGSRAAMELHPVKTGGFTARISILRISGTNHSTNLETQSVFT